MTEGLTRTRYQRSVLDPATMPNVIGLGSNNRKLGDIVTKGRFRGYRIHTMTLEERATCPSTCIHWTDCYGNNMPFAKRVDHTAPDFLGHIERKVADLLAKRPQGILLRLHVLGDFYSSDYVDFWREMLDRHPKLAIWGYTARNQFLDPIGVDIAAVSARFPGRFEIRESDGGWPGMSTVSIKHESECPPDAFVCPEQTGKTKSCATCGACWSTTKNVAFLQH
jgi:hypothetical protein